MGGKHAKKIVFSMLSLFLTVTITHFYGCSSGDGGGESLSVTGDATITGGGDGTGSGDDTGGGKEESDPVDTDSDGWTIADGDCNDNDPSINPGVTEICGDGIDQNCDGQDGPSSGQQITFEKYVGGGHYDYLRSIQQTDDSGYILYGFTESFNADGTPCEEPPEGGCAARPYYVKLDSNGNYEWGGVDSKEGRTLAYDVIKQTTDGGYVMLAESLRLIKIDANGVHEWDYDHFDGDLTTYSQGHGSVIEVDDGYVMAGAGNEKDTMSIVKIDFDGNYKWSVKKDNIEHVNMIRRTPDNGTIAFGISFIPCSEPGCILMDNFYLLKLDEDGGQEWEQSSYEVTDIYKPMRLDVISDGYVITGLNLSAYGKCGLEFKIRLIRTDLSGNVIKDGMIDQTVSYFVGSIEPTPDGGLVFAEQVDGNLGGSYDIRVVKLGSDGKIDWKRDYGSSGYDGTPQLITTDDCGYAVGVATYDFYMIKMDSNGEVH